MQGYAYVFLRQDGLPSAQDSIAEVGWGFTVPRLPNASAAWCGAAEDPAHSPLAHSGQDVGYWERLVEREEEMLYLFRRRNFHAFKKVKVSFPSPFRARQEARKRPADQDMDDGVPGLDHIVRILKAYGVKELPVPASGAAPSHWFSGVNGAYAEL